MSTARARLASGCALVALVAAAWLLVPRAATRGGERSRAVRVVLVDASASVRRTRARWTAWARSELALQARAAAEAHEDLCVIGFADDVAVRVAPQAPEELLALLAGRGGEPPFDPAAHSGDDGATRLTAALESAAGLAADPRRAPGSVVVLGDGTWTGADPGQALARLAQAGVRLALRPPPPPEESELGLADLRLPRTVEVGAPLFATLRVGWAPAPSDRRGTPPAVLQVELEQAGERRTFEHPLSLPPVPASWTEAIPLGPAGPGRTALVVRAQLAGGRDPLPENDTLAGSVRGAGSLTVGVLAEAQALPDARQAFPTSGGFLLPGLELVFLTPERLEEELPGLAALVAYDLSAEHADAPALEAFVRAGHGFLALAGWRFLADWVPGRAPGPLARLLPLEPRAPEAPPRDVVLLVDGSGSMAGAPFAMLRAAAVALVGAALPSDRLSLRFFTTELEDELLLRERGAAGSDPAGAEQVAERLLAARVPRGQTRILAALLELALERRERAGAALVLLLSDGREGREREAPAPAGVSAAEVRRALAAAHAELVPIAVGEDPDVDFLRALLAPGEELAQARTLSELESVFRRSVGGARVRAGAIALSTPASGLGALAAEALGTGAEQPLPPLARLVQSAPRAGAEVAWESDRGEPVLGLWRVGLGRCALFASLPGREWAPGWSGALGAGAPASLGPLLRWLARSPGSSRGTLELAVVDGRLELSGLAPEDPLLVTLHLTTDDGQERSLVLGPRAAPSGVLAEGLRSARLEGPGWPAGPGSAASVELSDGELVAVRLAHATPAEFRTASDPTAGLEERLADLARSPPSVSAAGARVQGRLGPWCLAAGLLLVFGWALAGNGRQGIDATGR